MPSLDVDSPLGTLALEECAGTLVRLSWGATGGRDETATLAAARDQLAAYFAGRLHAFDLPLAPRGTPYQARVWAALRQIPHGATTTYGALARALASVPRAIGGACGANRIPIIIPCHRVLAAGGRSGGFSGFRGVQSKRRLLAFEGTGPGTLPLLDEP